MRLARSRELPRLLKSLRNLAAKAKNIEVFVRVRPPSKAEDGRRDKIVAEVVEDRQIRVGSNETFCTWFLILLFNIGCGSRLWQHDDNKNLPVRWLPWARGVARPSYGALWTAKNARVRHGRLHVHCHGLRPNRIRQDVHNVRSTRGQETTTLTLSLITLQREVGCDDGLIARSVKYLFSAIKLEADRDASKSYTMRASYYEIYNEQVNDLLRLESAPREIKWNVKSGYYVESLLLVECESVDDVFSVLSEGAKNRKMGTHNLNKDSSRSHCIMTLHVDSLCHMDAGPPVTKLGRILFVDLAGNERLKKSKSSGEMLKETGSINRSLFTLGKVISCLAEGKKGDVVPYRESMLTKLLMESLGGNSLALMIACISPAVTAVDETLSTLHYATCTKKIINVPTVNMDEKDKVILQLQKDISSLKQENKLLRTILGVSAEEEVPADVLASLKSDEAMLLNQMVLAKAGLAHQGDLQKIRLPPIKSINAQSDMLLPTDVLGK
ncbi:kinesin-like protein KIF17 [Selaginella moellendorffii]|uniref:kinesin-like protein KIF17 n=1 Tax=Selaginella moellendorffii TaxID=88036 RepID=UPI000D1D0AAF|nr:kinesin-like protein KIF17 [Selaginella moellendorffii]|eukprot:XP_024527288.1 kinesin-like protein KIF17 [Selaginella moellendorffii]